MLMIERVFTGGESCLTASDRADKVEKGRIESFFEKISQRNANIKGCNNQRSKRSLGLCDGHGEGEGEGDGSGGESDDELLLMEPGTIGGGVGGSCAIVDMLLNKAAATTTTTGGEAVMTRDMKISRLNDKLMMKLPPLRGDEVTFVGSSFMKNGSLEPYYQNCIVQNAHGVACDAVDGIDIVNVNSETRLLLAWTDLIQRENPDIIIGYNIFQFDYDFMFHRAKENGCEKYFLKLSRKKDEICANKKYGCDEYELEKTQIILATGEYNLNYVKMAGRLQIDMYTYFRRDYNLPSYKLDDVAGQYISDDIVDVVVEGSGGGGMGLLTRNVAGLKLGDYIHLEICGFTNDYLDQGRKFAVLSMTPGGGGGGTVLWLTPEDSELCGELIRGIFAQKKKRLKWCIAKDDVSPQEIFRLTNGDGRDLARVAKYCLQDCNLVHHLLSKIDVLTGFQEMSRLCSVPVSFLVLRGQGIKLTSYVAKKCREKNTLMPDLVKQDVRDSGYEGAIVLPPKCNMYIDEPVAVLDFASLYPSCMISHNFSHDSKMSTSEYDMSGKLIVCSSSLSPPATATATATATAYIDVEFDVFEQLRNPAKPKSSKLEKTKVGTKVCRWAQLDNNAKSIMPSILEELLAARKETRTKIKLGGKDMDPFIQNILDKRQLAYKLTANSLYGQCGSRTSTFYDKDLAASTTATGRKMIMYAKRVIEEVYGGGVLQPVSCYAGGGHVVCNAEYVYGDTDSVFFTFGLQDPLTREPIRGRAALEITIELAQRAARKCTDGLVAPMELSYEKTMMPFILLSKKRYVGMLYETDPTRGKMKAMGLSLKRRDSCDYLKDTYGEILNILMKDQKLDKALAFLKTSLTDLINGNVSMDKLTITKSLRGYYKNPAQIAHAVLAERVSNRDPGNKPKPGDRIPFVHIVVSEIAKKKLLQGEKIEIPEYVAQKKLKIDYAFYITHQLMNPLIQLFVLSVEEIVQSRHVKEYTKAVAMKGYLREIRRLENEFPDAEVFAKKKEKFQIGVVKRELFDDFLLKIEQDKQNIRAITHFF